MRLNPATVRNVQKLCAFDGSVVEGWCQLTVDSLFNSPSKSLSAVAGSMFQPIYFIISHLNITLFDADSITKSLTNVLIDAAKENILPEMLVAELNRCIGENHVTTAIMNVYERESVRLVALIDEHKRKATLSLPSYESIQWRLDVKISTPACKDNCEHEMNIFVNTKTKRDGSTDAKVLRIEQQTLKYVTQQLELALGASKSHHFRKVAKSADFVKV